MQISLDFFRSKINLPVRVISTLLILALAVYVGFKVGASARFLLVFLAAIVVIVFIMFFDVRTLVYLIAFTWWFPVSMDRFFPFAAMFGPFFRDITLPELLVYGGVVLALLMPRQRSGRIFQDPVLIFLVLLLLGGLIAAENIQTEMGMSLFRRSTFYFFAMIVLCKAFLTDIQIIKRVLFLLFVSSMLFLAMVLFIQFFAPSLWQPGQAYINSTRIGGIYTLPFFGAFYFGPNNVGLITNIISVMALAYLLLESLPIYKRAIVAATVVLNFSVLVFTGSRASIVSAVLTIALIMVYLSFVKNNFKAVLYAVVIIAVLAVMISGFVNEEIADRIQNLVVTENDPYGSFPVRVRLLEYGLSLFFENPFGIGYGTFVTMTDNNALWEQNLFLNTALGAGFFGLIGLVVFFVTLFWRAFRKLVATRETTYLYALAGCITFGINSLFTDPNAETSIYLSWFVLGITLAAVSLSRQPVSSAKILAR